MTWVEYIETLTRKPIVLFSTATTGLSPLKDKLLAVTYVRLHADNDGHIDVTETDTVIQAVSRDELLASEQYHKISYEMMLSVGVGQNVMEDKLKSILQDAECFSYNPKFQAAFLNTVMGDATPFIHDAVLLLKGAEMHLCMEAKNAVSIDAMERWALSRLGKTPSMRQMCIGRGLPIEDQYGRPPVVLNADNLKNMWYLLGTIPITIQDELL